MGSRMPSRRGSLICPMDTRQRHLEELGIETEELETIQSVATVSTDDVSRSATQSSGGSSTFSPEQLAAAMKSVAVSE
jgi:hypothetical protein